MSTAAGAHAIHKDYEGAKLGMWIFLFTEILLFGGLFLLYSVYRSLYTPDFHTGGQHLNAVIGVANTFVLLTSSLTVALAVSAIQKGERRTVLICLGTTIAFGFLFLVNKYIEWSAEIREGIYPGGPALAKFPPGEKIFYGLYYCMTGLHGLHVVAGLIVLSITLAKVWRNRVTSSDFTFLENSALYWHLVDIIWIFLLPLLYLAA